MQTRLLLDLDGTLIDTPHYQAWCRALQLLDDRHDGHPLDYQEYIDHIAGRPRLEGAARLLELKGVGAQGHIANESIIHALAESKQREFVRMSEGADLFDDALELLRRVEAVGQCVTFYTASDNAPGLFDIALRRHGLFLNQQIDVARHQPNQSREALFRAIATDLPSECITVIDDSPYAADAACCLGMRAFQICRSDLHPVAFDPRCTILSSLDEVMLPLSAVLGEAI